VVFTLADLYDGLAVDVLRAGASAALSKND